MAEEQLKKSDGFVLYIDEERCDAIGWLMTVYNNVKNQNPSFKFMPGFDQFDKLVIPLWNTIGDAQHKRGWCKDPGCTDNQKKV